MNLYEVRFEGEKCKHLFKSEMDLSQIARMLNSDIKFCKIGNKVIEINEIVEVEYSNIETENKEMYDRMRPDIPIIEFPIYKPTMEIDDMINAEQCDIDKISKYICDKIRDAKKWR